MTDRVTDTDEQEGARPSGVAQKRVAREAWPVLDRVDPANVCRQFVQRVPISYARRFQVIGLNGTGDALQLVTTDPSHLGVLDNIAALLDVPATPVIAAPDQIEAALNGAYSRQASGVERVIDQLDTAETAADLVAGLRDVDLLDNASRAPVIRLVNLLLFEAVKRRASDVHVQPYADRLQVRLRIDGVLYDYVQPPKHLQEEVISRIKVLGGMNIAEKRLAQDGRTTVAVGDKRIDLRISSLPTSHGERIVLRLLDKSARLYELPELGMSAQDLAVFRRLIQHTHGIILVTGPTGSGKSTTLYAALQELNGRELNILTLEDPIEYALPGISQTQVSDKKGLTFATGLRTVLRQDPDIVMVGEIRDEETARMAVQSSLTGHLVFSTLHTNDAAGAVARLLDLGIEPYLVASSLLGVMAQRLVRRICTGCRAEVPLAEEDRQRLKLAPPAASGPDATGAPPPVPTVAAGRGCPRCLDTGYFGRVGIFELLEVTETVRQLILQRSEASALKAEAVRAGMTTLRSDALDKLSAQRTTVQEVLRVTHSDDDG